MKTPPGVEFLFDTALKSDFLYWLALRLGRDTLTRSILATPPEVVANASPAEQARFAESLEHILPIAPRRVGLLNDARVIPSFRRLPERRPPLRGTPGRVHCRRR